MSLISRRQPASCVRRRLAAAGLVGVICVLTGACTGETEPTAQVSTSEAGVGATLRAKVTWSEGERGYLRWEISESSTFSSGVSQTTRRDFGPMGGAGGPLTIDERVRSSSCAGVSGNCTVLTALRPGARYYVRFCGELFAPSSTGYRCFDSNTDQDPPYEYDSFDTLPHETLLTSPPDVASERPGELDLFVRGTNEELLQNHYDYRAGYWSGWKRPATSYFGDDSMTSAPGASSFAAGYGFDVLARGVDNVLYHSRVGVGAQQNLNRLPGVVISGPDAEWAAPEGRLDVVACGPTNQLQHISNFGANVGWGVWKTIGGGCTADPTIVDLRSPDYTVNAFARGTDGAVYRWVGSSDVEDPWRVSWSSPTRIDGLVTSGVDATSSDASRVDLFARGATNELLYNRYLNGTWSGWQNLGGDLTSDPTAISPEPGRIEVFSRCAEDAFQQWTFSQGVWSRAAVGDCSTNIFEAEGPDELLDDDPDDPEVDPEQFAGASAAQAQPLRLTAQSENYAMTLLEGDTHAQKLLGNAEYRVEKIGPWTELGDDGTDRLVGATLILQLSHARAWPMTAWPEIGYLPKQRGYIQSISHFGVRGAREVLADIDFAKGQVVGISPLGGVVTERPPGERSMKPSPWRGD